MSLWSSTLPNKIIFELIGRVQGSGKRFVDVEVLPLHRTGRIGCHKARLFLLLFYLRERDGIIYHSFNIQHIFFCQDNRDGLLCFDFLNFCLPSVDALQWVLIINSDADHKAVCVLVLDFAINSELVVAAGVVDFDLILLLLNILDAAVHVKDSWLVVLRELVEQVVGYHCRLSNCRVTHKHNLDLDRLTRIRHNLLFL